MEFGGNGEGSERVPAPMLGLLHHRRLRHDVQAYVDGELDGEAHAQVARHLSVCWDCSSLAETMRLIKRSLGRRRDRNSWVLSEHRLRRFASDLASGGDSTPFNPE